MEQDKVSFRGVRKGAWTEEEDDLLRGCIDKYGQGEWHKVPLRAGLKRCRKSCRLRWLNYLNPSIKRGEFTDDEIDLIVRLHKLLGNRWTLIAGRLPGRTANDVKNYWNTHMVRKIKTRSTSIIRPRPRTISREFTRLKQAELADPIPQPDDSDKPCPPLMSPENDTGWWESMMLEGGFHGERPESPGNRQGEDGWNEETSFDIDLWNILPADQEEYTVI